MACLDEHVLAASRHDDLFGFLQPAGRVYDLSLRLLDQPQPHRAEAVDVLRGELEDELTAADPGLLRIVARAHDIQSRLSQNTELTVNDVAREEHVTAAYIYTLLRLPWLAPDITMAIVNGRQPQHFNAKMLMRQASQLPTDWIKQRALLGFH